MQHTNTTAGIEFSYLAVLLLLAYVMSSAPRYVRQFKERKSDIKIERVSPIKEVLKLSKYYAVDPYLKAWNQLVPKKDPTVPQPSVNLAVAGNPVSR
jgi:hypothetical protein